MPEPESQVGSEWADPTPPAGHAEVMRGLWRAVADEHLAHALLFTGPRGIGKFTAARWFVRGLFCERVRAGDLTGPCGACPPCKRLAARGHPDLFVIEPVLDKTEYHKIGRFVPRDEDGPSAEEFLALRPVEAGWRVVLVREMERTQAKIQNTLLKLLEEPGERVLWILESSRPVALLPTIRSRCVRVNLEPLEDEDTREVLRRCGLPASDAAAVARWSRGAPGAALSLHEGGAIELRDLLRDVLLGRAPAFGVAPAAQRLWELEGTFVAKTPTGVQRARARFAVDLALAVVRDMLALDAGLAAEDLAHGDLVAELLATPGGAPRIRRLVDALLQARRDIDSNVTPVSVIDLLFLALEPRPLSTPAAGAGAAR